MALDTETGIIKPGRSRVRRQNLDGSSYRRLHAPANVSSRLSRARRREAGARALRGVARRGTRQAGREG
eukprot:997379-Pleurochrysis_carterae.AAC.1